MLKVTPCVSILKRNFPVDENDFVVLAEEQTLAQIYEPVHKNLPLWLEQVFSFFAPSAYENFR